MEYNSRVRMRWLGIGLACLAACGKGEESFVEKVEKQLESKQALRKKELEKLQGRKFLVAVRLRPGAQEKKNLLIHPELLFHSGRDCPRIKEIEDSWEIQEFTLKGTTLEGPGGKTFHALPGRKDSRSKCAACVK